MNIAIDCRHIDSSGVGVYLRECLPFFCDSANTFLLFGDSKKLEKNTKKPNVEILNCVIKPFSLRDTFAFPRNILRKINRCDLYYSPFFNIPGGIKVPIYTTIHDIIFPDMPDLTSRLGLAIRMFFFRRCFRYSSKIFTVSEFSRSRIKYYSKNKVPVVVTHSAIQPHFLDYRKAVREINKKKSIIFIGNIKKHKGIEYLLDAFLLARQEGLQYQLIIIGSRENFRTSDNSILKKIDSLGNDVVLFTGYISDERLMDFLSTAALLVQPSLYEGFGLPPLEAMVLGTNVLISDIPVFKEIFEDFPVTFFKSGDTLDLKAKILELLYKKEPKPLVLPQFLMEKYNFKKTSKIILEEMEKNIQSV